MRNVLCAAVAVLLTAVAARAAEPAEIADEVLAASSVTGGLFVQLDFSSPAMMKRLAGSGKFLAYGISSNRERVDAARQSLAADGLAGLATADYNALKGIPCVNDGVTLLAAEDIASLLKRGLPVAEIGRVLAPGGVACLGVEAGNAGAIEAAFAKAGIGTVAQVVKGRAWVVVRKARPAGMDNWTHVAHGPDGNAVSRDQLVGPPDTVRWYTGPIQPSVRGGGPIFGAVGQMVSAGGRNFYLIGNRQIIARDGFTGLVAWSRTLADQYYGASYTRLIAVGDRVYASTPRKIEVIDAANGQLVRDLPGSAWAWLVIGDRMVVQDQSAITCFDLATGTSKWSTKVRLDRPDGQPPVAEGKRVYFLQKDELRAVDIETGNIDWKVDTKEKFGAGACLAFVQADLLMCRRPNGETREFAAFAAKDGSLLWKFASPAKPKNLQPLTDQPFFFGGQVWLNDWTEKGASVWKCLSASDGSVVRTLPSGVGGAGCHPLLVTDRYAVGKRPCSFMDWETGKVFDNRGARGACRIGLAMGNGQLYMLQTNVPFGCVCGPFFPGVSGCGSDSAFSSVAAASQPDEQDRF
ncbi:MAG: PQQ-binding-like beta-propeller repeat protein, partial [Phycisphaerae bacterium]|nr:PQQ-binding-like beta-propeller repeat protein [Phycisphaerae bacterium]